MAPLRPGEFDDLERALLHLADDVRFPATPVFQVPSTSVSSGRGLRRRFGSVWWKAGLAVTAALIAMTLVLPDTRRAVADWLGLPGIQIEIGDRADDPPPTVTSIGGSLLLGRGVAIDDVRDQVGFVVARPGSLADQGPPEVYLNDFDGVQVVSLLYPASDQLPEIGETDVGLLLTQIDLAGNTSMWITKRAAAELPPQPVTIDGAQGLWIQGGVLTVDAGDPFWTYQRRSGNVLVWEAGGVTYRLESGLPLDDALAIAESLAPIEETS